VTDIAIKVENLTKEFQIGQERSGDFRESFGNTLKSMLGTKGNKETFTALDDISFEVKKGEALGIIGRNGAGKSTLLKILSRIMEPTKGRIEINGRVSSLLEVGTGFHPELTGRENIYLNGTILGMTRREVKSKFDEIIDFSGVEKFIDTPVKHYSSGMKVRLAFSVAAHLEPEILIVDEVLAVGDAEFQKKCLGKMDDVSKKEGRTVIFVSHNLGAVTQLCQTGILVNKGELIYINEVNKVVNKYVGLSRGQHNTKHLNNMDLRKGNGQFKVKKVGLLNDNQEHISIAKTGDSVLFEIMFDQTIDISNGGFRIDFALDNEQDVRIAWFSSDVVENNLPDLFETVILKIPKFQFGAGTYYLTFYATLFGEVVDYVHQAYSFKVENGDFFGTGKTIPKSQTFIYSEHELYSS
jgi:lipopolysaccharide transport system ATP-binding protein